MLYFDKKNFTSSLNDIIDWNKLLKLFNRYNEHGIQEIKLTGIVE